MSTNEPLASEIEDITAAVPDVNTCDRIYRSPAGYGVKVRTVERVTPAAMVFSITAALCDPETGKAVPFADGHFIPKDGEHHEEVILAHAPTDAEVRLARACARIAQLEGQVRALGAEPTTEPLPADALQLSPTPVDVAERLHQGHMTMVRRVERALMHHAQRHALVGVGRHPDHARTCEALASLVGAPPKSSARKRKP